VQGHFDVANAGTTRLRVPAGLSGPDDLTNREIEIVQLLAERLQNKEIADRLSIAPQTVNYHLKHIYDKLGVRSRRHAVRRAAEKGIPLSRRD
jgi:LuxR family maltose regulon positive regulatory protein